MLTLTVKDLRASHPYVLLVKRSLSPKAARILAADPTIWASRIASIGLPKDHPKFGLFSTERSIDMIFGDCQVIHLAVSLALTPGVDLVAFRGAGGLPLNCTSGLGSVYAIRASKRGMSNY